MINKIIQAHKFNKKIRDLVLKNKPIKLHVACGTNYIKDWINIDNNSDKNIHDLDVNWDLRIPLPTKDNTVDFVYNEHFLEHLTVSEGQKVLKEFLRVLKPGGVLRIAMPDLKTAVDRYYNPNWKSEPMIKKFRLEYIQTRAEMINTSFHSWGHKWLYDIEEINRRLKEAGFSDIESCKLRHSRHLVFQNIESRDESNLIVESTK